MENSFLGKGFPPCSKRARTRKCDTGTKGLAGAGSATRQPEETMLQPSESCRKNEQGGKQRKKKDTRGLGRKI